MLPPRAAVAPVAAGAAAAAEPETFYDAPELPLPVFPVAVAAGAGEALRFEDAALLYLRYQCRTGDQIVGLLQASKGESAAPSWVAGRRGWPQCLPSLLCCCVARHPAQKGSVVPRPLPPSAAPLPSILERPQALELQVHSLQEKVSALQAAAEARARHRRWLPELPETVSTRQALLGAALLASATAAAAMLYGRQQALAAR